MIFSASLEHQRISIASGLPTWKSEENGLPIQQNGKTVLAEVTTGSFEMKDISGGMNYKNIVTIYSRVYQFAENHKV